MQLSSETSSQGAASNAQCNGRPDVSYAYSKDSPRHARPWSSQTAVSSPDHGQPQVCKKLCPSASQASLSSTELLHPLADHPRYQWLANLARGSSGFVQHALDMQTGQEVAIKFIRCGPVDPVFDEKNILRELLNHRLAGSHPNIVELHEVFVVPHHLAIVMGYCNAGDMSELIDSRGESQTAPLSEPEAAWFFQQLVCAVQFCHRLGIVIRDIKLDNMLLQGKGAQPLLRICDFGYSKDEMGQSVCKSTCGTPEYMAPEVLCEGTYDGKSADVWSIGVSLFVMLTGEFPFTWPTDSDMPNAARMQCMFARIISGKAAPTPQLSATCKDLLQGILRSDPGERATMEQIAVHPWLSKACPHLPPMDMNDQLVAAMDRGDITAGALNVCRQSAADIQALVKDCAEIRAFHTRKAKRAVRRRIGTASRDSPKDDIQISNQAETADRGPAVQSPFAVVPWGKLPASLTEAVSGQPHANSHMMRQGRFVGSSHSAGIQLRSQGNVWYPPSVHGLMGQGWEGGPSQFHSSYSSAALQLPLQQTWSERPVSSMLKRLPEEIRGSNSADAFPEQLRAASRSKLQPPHHPLLPRLGVLQQPDDFMTQDYAHRELLHERKRPGSAQGMAHQQLSMRPGSIMSTILGSKIDAHHSAPALQQRRSSDWQPTTPRLAVLQEQQHSTVHDESYVPNPN